MSGDTLFVLIPQASSSPAANFATFDTRNSRLVLDFDGSTAEATNFGGLTMPRNYNAGGLTVILHVITTSATSGTVVFSAAIERENTDIDSDSFATAVNSSATTVNATSGIIFDVTITLTNSQIDGLLAGEPFTLQIARVPGDAGDTVTTDCELWGVEIKET